MATFAAPMQVQDQRPFAISRGVAFGQEYQIRVRGVGRADFDLPAGGRKARPVLDDDPSKLGGKLQRRCREQDLQGVSPPWRGR